MIDDPVFAAADHIWRVILERDDASWAILLVPEIVNVGHVLPGEWIHPWTVLPVENTSYSRHDSLRLFVSCANNEWGAPETLSEAQAFLHPRYTKAELERGDTKSVDALQFGCPCIKGIHIGLTGQARRSDPLKH